MKEFRSAQNDLTLRTDYFPSLGHRVLLYKMGMTSQSCENSSLSPGRVISTKQMLAALTVVVSLMTPKVGPGRKEHCGRFGKR
jgi:hypothetical protein